MRKTRTKHSAIKLYKGLHAIKRAEERYGLKLTSSDLEEIGRLIREKKGAGWETFGTGNRMARIIERRSNVASVWEVMWQGQPVIALYSRTFKIPMTFLPIDGDYGEE